MDRKTFSFSLLQAQEIHKALTASYFEILKRYQKYTDRSDKLDCSERLHDINDTLIDIETTFPMFNGGTRSLLHPKIVSIPRHQYK